MEKYTLISKIGLSLLFVWVTVTSVQGQSSMYQDNKAQQVGDIITVVLQENISGSTSSDAQNATNAKAGAGGSLGGNFMPFQPTFGGDVEVNYDSGEQMQTNQGQLLNGYMSVEITDMTASGNLIIKGNRSTEINGEKHKIDLSGIVRPKDINGRNQVLSYRVSNAKINYEKEGGLDRIKKKDGFIKKAVLTGVGIALGAAAVMKAMN
ncbi:flagellar basal body L-ring protein FlgH [Fodinibius saliphilus]|uniref:flagellar basal body L-ring protein FlgH n=1 Tax=Fodinibius saliphilus TaxID=1920650 RepID=UPI001108D9D2|nr:flagellar basal body L-ring protein FlgH [Fodinibius saliphilus]